MTPGWPTRPGSTTTGSAARTTSRRTGSPARRPSRPTRRSGPRRGPTGRSWPGASATWPARPASASSWTSAPACRRPTTPTRWPSRSRRSAGSSTSTTTRWCSSHARALLTSRPEGVTDYLDADLRDTDRDPRAGRRHAGLQPAGRDHAAGHPALHPGPGRGAADRGPAGRRGPVRQLPGHLARGQRHLAGRDGRDDQADERASGRGQPRRAARGTWSRGSSRTWTWSSRAW